MRHPYRAPGEILEDPEVTAERRLRILDAAAARYCADAACHGRGAEGYLLLALGFVFLIAYVLLRSQ